MKHDSQITAMRTGGALLREVKQQLQTFTQIGHTFADIEAEAQRLISKAGAVPNFSLVPGYEWATCVMKNDEMCHGIPVDLKVVEDGDVITIDVGLLYQGWNLDTSITFGVGSLDPDTEAFLAVGKKSLKKAINKARTGATVYDVSRAMQRVVERAGYSAIFQLTGHGIGKELHMEPSIPCVANRADKNVRLMEGQTVAIEIMYARGDAFLKLDKDKWTYRTADGSLTGMFEETVLVTNEGPEILT